MAKKPIGTKTSTGQKCPESGVWRVETGTDTIPLAENNIVPPHRGKAATWVLIAYA
jgi:hypothetical protein